MNERRESDTLNEEGVVSSRTYTPGVRSST